MPTAPSTSRPRRVFPGGNTPDGFHSFYRYILPRSDATRIMIIKGGPGVGKSVFMTRIANEMSKRGYIVEYHQCSADSSSIDGVVFPQIGVALFDGTSPHVEDPLVPGAIDEIINLGVFLDEEGVGKHRASIMATSGHMSTYFQRCYRYLRAAKSVYDDIQAIYTEATDFGLLNRWAQEAIDTYLAPYQISATPGQARHLFGSAISPGGPINFLDTVIGPMEHILVVKGSPGTGKATLVEKIARAALKRGFDVEAFHCPFDPEKLEHLVIPQINLAVTTSTEPHLWEGKSDRVIDTSQAVSNQTVRLYEAPLERANATYRQLLDDAVSWLDEAKRLHDELEAYYVPNMQFDAVEEYREEILQRILTYAGE